MDQLQELLSLCKASVSIEINNHRSYYQTASQALEDEVEEWKEETGEEIWQKMIETDTIICIQAYPNTPVGFYRVYDADINSAILRIINAIKK